MVGWSGHGSLRSGHGSFGRGRVQGSSLSFLSCALVLLGGKKTIEFVGSPSFPFPWPLFSCNDNIACVRVCVHTPLLSFSLLLSSLLSFFTLSLPCRPFLATLSFPSPLLPSPLLSFSFFSFLSLQQPTIDRYSVTPPHPPFHNVLNGSL